jgi:hypothetical protein
VVVVVVVVVGSVAVVDVLVVASMLEVVLERFWGDRTVSEHLERLTTKR